MPIPQSQKQNNEANFLLKNKTNQPQVKTNNTEKLDSIINNIAKKKNKKTPSTIMNNYNSNTENDNQFKSKLTKSPKKNSIPQKEESNFTTKSKESFALNEEDEKNEDITKYEMKFPEEYHGNAQKASKLIKQEVSNDGKILKIFENNKREVIFPSGMRKEIYPDGYTIVFFGNKDIKQVNSGLNRPSVMVRMFTISANLRLLKLLN